MQDIRQTDIFTPQMKSPQRVLNATIYQHNLENMVRDGKELLNIYKNQKIELQQQVEKMKQMNNTQNLDCIKLIQQEMDRVQSELNNQFQQNNDENQRLEREVIELRDSKIKLENDISFLQAKIESVDETIEWQQRQKLLLDPQ